MNNVNHKLAIACSCGTVSAISQTLDERILNMRCYIISMTIAMLMICSGCATSKKSYPRWDDLTTKYGAKLYLSSGTAKIYHIEQFSPNTDFDVSIGTYPDYESFKAAIAALPPGSAYAYIGSDIDGLNLLDSKQIKEILSICKKTKKRFYAVPGG